MINPDEEQQVLDQHKNALQEAVLLAKWLKTIQHIHASALVHQDTITLFQSKLDDGSHRNHGKMIQKVYHDQEKLEDLLRHATIPANHPIRRLVSNLISHVLDICATEQEPTILDTSCSSSSSSHSLQVKLPKLSLPTFKEDPMKWGIFWDQFNATVHNNPQLDNGQKLSYLRDCIKDPKVSPLLYRAIVTPGQYNELVQLLKERYDKKRFIHQQYTTGHRGQSVHQTG